MRLLASLLLLCGAANATITPPPPANCAYGRTAGSAIMVQTAAFGTFSSNCATGASNTSGNLLVVRYGWLQASGSNPVTAIADTQGNTYANVNTSAPFDGTIQGVAYAANIAGGSGNQVTVTLTSATGVSSFYVYVEEYTGVATTSPLDTFNVGTATILTTCPCSISVGVTTTTPGDLIISNVNSPANLGTISAGSGYLVGFGGVNSYAAISAVVGAAGAYTAQTLFTSEPAHVTATVVAFKPAGSGLTSFNVWHFNAGVISGSTAWSPDAWGDGTSSTSTGGLSGAISHACASGTLDQITLNSTTTYAAPTTTSTLTIPDTASTCGILVTGTNNAALPDSGQRVTFGASPTPPTGMPLIQAATNFTVPLLTPAAGAHDFEFYGIAFGVNGGTTSLSAPLVLGAGLNNSLTPATAGARWIFASDWIAGNYNQAGPCRGFVIESRDSIIKDSYLDEFGNYGQDCQAILTTGAQNLLVRNNWIGATTENYICGGAGTSIQGVMCGHNRFIGNYFVKHIQWRIYASNTTPTDARDKCVYYPPDQAYDGIGGGEIWVNGTNSLSGNGAFPPTGSGVTSSTTTTGAYWECGPAGTWQGPFTSKTFVSKYGTASQIGGQAGNEKNNFEIKYGHDFQVWGNVLANMWASLQSELEIENGPDTNNPNSSRGTHGVTLEYNVLRDSVGGFANGDGLGTIKPDGFYGVFKRHNLLDNVTQGERNCVGCAYNSIPAQTGGGNTVLASSPAYDGNTGNSVLTLPGGWVTRHNTAVNSAVNISGSIGYSTASVLSSAAPANFTIGAAFIDNVFTMGAGVGGQQTGGSTASQVFNAGGAFFGSGSPPAYRFWAPGGILANNIISEDTAQGGTAFTGTVGLLGSNGPGMNGVLQGTTMAPGATATSSCCFTNYLPAIQPTNAGIGTPAGTPATWSSGSWSWTYPDYTLSTSSTACSPAGANTTGAPAAPQACTAKASDGTNPGADIPTVMGFTQNAISGVYNPNLSFMLGTPVRASSSSAIISYQSPKGGSACTVVVSNNENMSSPQGSHSSAGNSPTFADTVTGLTGNFFWYTVACADQLNGGKTLTRVGTFQL